MEKGGNNIDNKKVYSKNGKTIRNEIIAWSALAATGLFGWLLLVVGEIIK